MLPEAAERERMQCFYRVRSGMEITPLHHSGTGRGRAAPRCAAVLEQGLMAGRALGHRSQLSSPCLWGCAAAGSTAAPVLVLFLATPREAAEMVWPAAGGPLGACSRQRVRLPAAWWLLCRSGCLQGARTEERVLELPTGTLNTHLDL